MTKQDLRATIGENIRRRRLELGLSQKAVSEAVGLSQPQINRIENGVCSFPADLLAILSEALQEEPLYFLTPRHSEKSLASA